MYHKHTKRIVLGVVLTGMVAVMFIISYDVGRASERKERRRVVGIVEGGWEESEEVGRLRDDVEDKKVWREGEGEEKGGDDRALIIEECSVTERSSDANKMRQGTRISTDGIDGLEGGGSGEERRRKWRWKG